MVHALPWHLTDLDKRAITEQIKIGPENALTVTSLSIDWRHSTDCYLTMLKNGAQMQAKYNLIPDWHDRHWLFLQVADHRLIIWR